MAFGLSAFGDAPFGDVPASAGATSWSVSPTSGHVTGAGQVLTATGVGTSWTGSPFSITGGSGTASITTQSTSSATAGSITLNITVLGTIVLSDGDTTTTYDGSAIAPGAPTIGTLTDPHNDTISITFSAPADNGGATITSYTATTSSGGFNASGAGSPLVISGINKGVSQTVTVTATNSVGTGSASSASNAVVPVTVPDAPTAASAVAGNTEATVSFSAPADNGGSTILSYIVTSSPGSITEFGASSPITVTGLTNGTPYTFTVVASNAQGASAASSASNSVTPADVVTITVRAPYLTTDTIGTKTFQIYEIDSGVLTAVGSAVTTGFAAIPNITNGWWIDIVVTPNDGYGGFNGIAVFSNINGSGKAAIELYSPPISAPPALEIHKIAPFLTADTVTTPGYQLYDSAGSTVGSHVTAGILAISGITNGYVAQLSLTPDSNNGAVARVLWDGA